jgi:hypothetical protein
MMELLHATSFQTRTQRQGNEQFGVTVFAIEFSSRQPNKVVNYVLAAQLRCKRKFLSSE